MRLEALQGCIQPQEIWEIPQAALTWWKAVPESQQHHGGVQGAVSCLGSGAALLCHPSLTWRGGDTAELLENVEEVLDLLPQLRAAGSTALHIWLGIVWIWNHPEISLKVGEIHGVDGA